MNDIMTEFFATVTNSTEFVGYFYKENIEGSSFYGISSDKNAVCKFSSIKELKEAISDFWPSLSDEEKKHFEFSIYQQKPVLVESFNRVAKNNEGKVFTYKVSILNEN